MKTKIIIVFITLLFFLGLGYWYAYLQTTPNNLNVILISVDTLRADHMGIYGYSKNTTPTIDKWAQNAFVFTNARTIVPHTYPSFASLMTGKSALSTGILTNVSKPIATSTATLATILHGQGYYTASFVANGWLRDKNLSNGFDSWNFQPYDEYKQVQEDNLETKITYAKHIKKAAQWIRDNKDKKFFLWVHLLDPHSPYNPPDSFRCLHNPDICQETISKTAIDLEHYRKSYEGWGPDCNQKNPASPADLALYESLYDGEISYSDNLLMDVFEAISATGLDKKTIVVFYGDHGEGFDHGYYFQHGILYDSNIKIPLIIKHPFFPGKQIDSVLMDNTDIASTLLSLLGIRPALSMQGINQSWAITGNKTIMDKKREYQVSTNHNNTLYSITDGTYKYIYSTSEACPYFRVRKELYDIVHDKNESKDMMTTNRDKPFVKQMENKLMRQIGTNPPPSRSPSVNPEQMELLKNFGYQ